MDGATGEKGTGEVADAGYYSGQIIPSIPETVVRGLVPEDLKDAMSCVWHDEGAGTVVQA